MPTPSPITCDHADGAGLCLGCAEEFSADPEAWQTYGDHPAGRENWRRLEAEMDAWAAGGQQGPCPWPSDDVPF